MLSFTYHILHIRRQYMQNYTVIVLTVLPSSGLSR